MEFRVNDKVYSLEFGWGEVLQIRNYGSYPMSVKFLNIGVISYTREGEKYKGTIRTLFFCEPKFENYEEMMIRPLWRPKFEQKYYFITSEGTLIQTEYFRFTIDDNRIKVGNCFETEQEAKDSKFYKVFHE